MKNDLAMTNSKPSTRPAGVKDEDVRTEYTALSQFYGQVIGFRFTAATIYFAGVAFVMQGELSKSKLALMIFFSIGMWLVEIRNRGIFYALSARGRQIESEYWGYEGQNADDPFYCRTVPPIIKKASPDDSQKPPPDPVRILWFYFDKPPKWTKYVISHTAGFDLVYGSVILFSLWHFLKQP